MIHKANGYQVFRIPNGVIVRSEFQDDLYNTLRDAINAIRGYCKVRV